MRFSAGLPKMLGECLFKGGCARWIYIFYFGTGALCLFSCTPQHLVRNRAGKYHNHLRIADLVLEIRGALCKHLAFATVFFAYLFISALHTIMTANNHNIHIVFAPLRRTYFIHSFFIRDNTAISITPNIIAIHSSFIKSPHLHYWLVMTNQYKYITYYAVCQ